MERLADQCEICRVVGGWRRVEKNEEGIVSREERETCVREVMRGKRSGEINWNALKLMERGCEEIC